MRGMTEARADDAQGGIFMDKKEQNAAVPKVFESEYRFCQILWTHEPIKSGQLALLCREELGWKPTTTYTVIKRLSERGVIKNENTVVSSLVSRDEIQAAEVEELFEKKFDRSLPAFLAAFTRNRRLKPEEIEEMQKMIDDYRDACGKEKRDER